MFLLQMSAQTRTSASSRALMGRPAFPNSLCRSWTLAWTSVPLPTSMSSAAGLPPRNWWTRMPSNGWRTTTAWWMGGGHSGMARSWGSRTPTPSCIPSDSCRPTFANKVPTYDVLVHRNTILTELCTESDHPSRAKLDVSKDQHAQLASGSIDSPWPGIDSPAGFHRSETYYITVSS